MVKKDCIFFIVLGEQFNLEREESTRFLDIYLHVDRIPEYKNMKKRKIMRKPIFSTYHMGFSPAGHYKMMQNKKAGTVFLISHT